MEFDLAYSQMNEAAGLSGPGLDLIFEKRPSFNEIRVRDITLTRRPRAAL